MISQFKSSPVYGKKKKKKCEISLCMENSAEVELWIDTQWDNEVSTLLLHLLPWWNQHQPLTSLYTEHKQIRTDSC